MRATVLAFLDLIAYAEGTSGSPLTKCNGYDVIVSGVDGPEVFIDFSHHPFANGRPAQQINHATPPLYSTAAGRYQFLLRIWKAYETMLHLPDFTPHSQDQAAIRMVHEAGALDRLNLGDIKGAITRCAHLWASFPGNLYGQGGKSMDKMLAKWAELSAQ